MRRPKRCLKRDLFAFEVTASAHTLKWSCRREWNLRLPLFGELHFRDTYAISLRPRRADGDDGLTLASIRGLSAIRGQAGWLRTDSWLTY